jgi:hypothetical protein
MKKILAIVFVLCVGIALAAPIRSMLASRGGEYTEEEPPYPLPDGVVAVEYLEGDGNSYIDTGIVPNNSVEIEVEARRTNGGGMPYLMGFGPDNDAPYAWAVLIRYASSAYGACIFVRGTYSASNVKVGITKDSFTKIRLTKTSVVVNDEVRAFSGADVIVQQGCRVYVFAGGGRNKPFGICPSGFLIRRASVFQDGECVWYGIPVRFVNEDGIWEGAMYDIISEELFYNQGTGAFIIGPDL